MKTIVSWIVYILIRSLILLVNIIPTSAGYWCCDRIARIGFWIDAKRRHRALMNVSRAFPERTPAEHLAIVKACYRNLLRVGYELTLVEKLLSAETVNECADFSELDKVADQIKKKKGAVVLSAHVGNWEVAGIVMALLGYPITAVAKGVQNRPLFDRYLKRLRERYGFKIVSSFGAVRSGRKILESGELITFIADQYARVGRIWVNFFGRPVAWTKAPASLAHRLNMPIVVGFCRRVGNEFKFKTTMYPAIVPDPDLPVREDIGRMTQIYVRYLESYIRKYPEDYLWLHRQWRAPRNGDEFMDDSGSYNRHATFDTVSV